MNDDELPKIPSFEELGISPDELEELERELAEAAGDDPDLTPVAGDSQPGEAAPTASPPPGGAKTPKKPKKSKKSGAGAGGGVFGRLRKKPKPASETKQEGPATPASAVAAAGAGKGEAPPSGVPVGRLGPSPLGGMRGPFTLAFLIAAGWLFSSARVVPPPAPASSPDTTFSAERAVVHVDRIARAAHPPGSPEHDRVREYLLETLTGLGFEPDVQTTTELIGRGPRARAATVRNVVARRPGSASSGAVLVTAHYDGRELARAAGDDGAGVATILESLRALGSGPTLRNDLIVLITDAEELGLLGARAFVNQHPWMADVSAVVSIEMRGGGGPSIMFETGDQNGWIVGVFKDSSPSPWANSLTYEVYKRLPNDTDFTPFKEAGRQGLNFAAIGRAHVYHQAYDSPENLARGTVQHHGVQALAVLRQLLDRELVTVDAPDVVYFTLPYFGLVWYPPVVSYGLSGLIALLLLVLLVASRRFGTRLGRVGLSACAAAAAGAAGYGMGWGLLRWLPRFHPEAGSLHGSIFHSEGWYVVALVAGCVAATTALFGLLRRWLSPSELALGAILLPALAAAGAGAVVPMGSLNLQWPVLAGLIGCAAVMGVGASQRTGLVRWVLLLILALPVLVLLVPLTELLWVAMTFRFAPALGVLVVVTLLLVMPLLDVMREPNGWWPALAGLLVGGAFLGVGLLLSRPGAARPAPSTLVYALDRGAGTARWATDVVDPGSGYDPARAWAATRVGEFTDTTSLGDFGGAGGVYAAASAPPVTAPAPLVTLVQGQPGVGSSLRLAVRSQIGAEMTRLSLRQGTGRITAVNGRPVSNDEAVSSVEHWGRPDGDIVFDLEMESNGPVELELVEHLLRPAELLGADPFRRPLDLAPDITRLSDRAMLLTRLVVNPSAGTVSAVGAVQPPSASGAGNGVPAVEPSPTDAGLQDSDTTAAPDTLAPVDTTSSADTTTRADTTGAADSAAAGPPSIRD